MQRPRRDGNGQPREEQRKNQRVREGNRQVVCRMFPTAITPSKEWRPRLPNPKQSQESEDETDFDRRRIKFHATIKPINSRAISNHR
jgi:hypothetical protein